MFHTTPTRYINYYELIPRKNVVMLHALLHTLDVPLGESDKSLKKFVKCVRASEKVITPAETAVGVY